MKRAGLLGTLQSAVALTAFAALPSIFSLFAVDIDHHFAERFKPDLPPRYRLIATTATPACSRVHEVVGDPPAAA